MENIQMNITIITPGHPGPDRKSLPPALTAPYLAALATPYAESIKILDLAVEHFDSKGPVPDVTLLSSTMAQFDQVFKIGEFLKAKGSKIFLGGPYATLAYDFDPRIKELADCVVFGEGEKALPQALADCQSGLLKPTYYMPIDSLDGMPFSRLDLLDHTRYFFSTAVIGTRGCLNNCAYCTIKDLYGFKFLKRPVEEVIEEIRYQTSRPNIGWLDRKTVEFWDDNPAYDLDWFKQLLEKMIPLKKWWLSQICLNVAEDEEAVKLMKASGCKGVFVGLESVSKNTLKAQNKAKVNLVERYVQNSKVLLKHGIIIVGAIMYGFDEDTKEQLFIDTPQILQKMGVTLLQTHMVTPYPHSDFFKLLEKENRLITKECKYYNGYTLVHKPKNLSAAALQEGFFNTRKQFYSWGTILKRMRSHQFTKYPEFLLWNILYRKPNYEVIPGVDAQGWLDFLRKS
jgi:radical SAM superfamily enzyme YgiQ (UPF0313 family)